MIEIMNLTKRYGNFTAVDGITLTVNPGEVTGLLGPNGAGKTTTMRMITGYFPPSSGSVMIDGIDIKKDPVGVKRKIGYLPESAPVYGDMLVYDYLKYIASIHGISSVRRIDETSGMCGLTSVMGMRIDRLSKGYRQRVGLAHAMIHDPEILVLDEPTNGLDPNQIAEIRGLIRDIARKKTVVLSTHILTEVEASCSRVVIINKGRIAADERTTNLGKLSGSEWIVSAEIKYCEADRLVEILSSEGMNAETDAGSDGAVRVRIASSGDIREKLFNTVKDNGWVMISLERGKSSLENIFKELTTGGSND